MEEPQYLTKLLILLKYIPIVLELSFNPFFLAISLKDSNEIELGSKTKSVCTGAKCLLTD